MAAKGVTLGQRVASFVNHPAGPKTSACAALLLRHAALRTRVTTPLARPSRRRRCAALRTRSPPPLRACMLHAPVLGAARAAQRCARRERCRSGRPKLPRRVR
jgi:hypothetical protein